MAALIKIRRDTSANWASNDPTLAQGELGLDTDTGVIKVGNGSDIWSDLLSIGVYNSNDRISKTVDTDTGSLIVDEFGKLYFDRGGTITFDDTGNLFAGTGNSNFKISLDDHTGDVTEYNFGHDGNLTLPAGATIGDLYGDSSTTLSAAPGSDVYIANNNGQQWIGPEGDGVYIGTDYTGNNHQWNFNTNGSLLLPDDGVIGDWYGFTTLSNTAGAAIATSPGNAVVVNPTDGTWIYADNKEYIFGANATVQLPGNIQLDSSSVIKGAASSTGAEKYIEAIDFSVTAHTVIMITSHGFVNSDKIYINNIGPGSTEELTDTYCYVKVMDPDNFEIYSDKELTMPIWADNYTTFVYSGEQPLNGTVVRIYDAGSVNISTTIPQANHDAGQINLNVSDKTWSLHADGNLVLPANGYILNSDMTVYGGGTGGGDSIVNGLNSLTVDGDGNIVLDGDEGAANRGLVWNWGNLNGGVNAGIRHDEDGITILSFNGGSGSPWENGSPVNIITNPGIGQNVWVHDIHGNLVLPANGYILNSDMTVYGGAGGGISITDFGEGFSLTASNKVVTNKLYSTNLTEPTQHYRLEVDTNGVVVLPDQSIINGSTLRGVYGTGEANYTGITIGPDADHREESWVWVDHTGVSIATEYSTNNYEWKFDNNGTLTLPGGNVSIHSSTSSGSIRGSTDTPIIVSSIGSTGSSSLQWVNNAVTPTALSGVVVNSGGNAGDVQILTGTYNPSNGHLDKSWTFGTDGNLTLPTGGDILDNAGTSILDRLSVTSTSAVLTKDQYNTTRLTFTGNANIETAGYLSGTGGLALVDSSSQQYVIVKSDRVQINTGFPDQGTGLQSYNQWQFQKDGVFKLPTTGIIENNGKQWTFGTNGNLTLPTGGEIHSAAGVGNVYINSNNGVDNYEWKFGDNGILTVPAEIMDMTGNNHVNLNDNGGIAIGTFGPNPVSIYTDDGNNYYSWWLDEKGFMSLPDCGSQPPTGTPDNGPAFAQSGGVLYWYDGSSWRTVNLT